MKKYLIYIVALLVLMKDQLAKLIVRSTFSLGQSKPIIKGVFHLTYVTNTGVIFGLFPGYQAIFQIATVLVVVLIFIYYYHSKPESLLINTSLGLIIGGAISNFIDRLYFSRVIDFLDFRVWPVFNFADSAIVIGVLLVVIGSLTRSSKHQALK